MNVNEIYFSLPWLMLWNSPHMRHNLLYKRGWECGAADSLIFALKVRVSIELAVQSNEDGLLPELKAISSPSGAVRGGRFVVNSGRRPRQEEEGKCWPSYDDGRD